MKSIVQGISSPKSFRDSKASFWLEISVIWSFQRWVSGGSPAAPLIDGPHGMDTVTNYRQPIKAKIKDI